MTKVVEQGGPVDVEAFVKGLEEAAQPTFSERIMRLPPGAGARRPRVSEVKDGFNPYGVTPGSARGR